MNKKLCIFYSASLTLFYLLSVLSYTCAIANVFITDISVESGLAIATNKYIHVQGFKKYTVLANLSNINYCHSKCSSKISLRKKIVLKTLKYQYRQNEPP